MTSEADKVALLFHGGTGSTMTDSVREFLESILPELEERLFVGERSIDLAVRCVSHLERSGLFNAGVGAISQSDGIVRRDAGAMNGKTLDALGVSQVRGIPGMAPLVFALLGKSAHVHLSGAMVERWARRNGFELIVEEPGSDPTLLWESQPGEAGEGTVGAVVRDRFGDVAAVTSTGGFGRMWPGRIGDSPIVGGGFYADNERGAISMTGTGEAILKSGGGAALLATLSHGGPDGGRTLLGDYLERIKGRFSGEAGFVGIDGAGRPFASHSSARMVHGLIRKGQRLLSDSGPGFFELP